MKKHDEKDHKQFEELEKQIGEWKDKYIRALADYQNLERRVASQRIAESKFAAEAALRKLLPVADTLVRAREHIKDQGLELAVKEFWQVLKDEGLEKIEVVGKQFDPHEMECIEVVEGEENKVTEEILTGYKLQGKVIRPAKVKVGKMKVDQSANAESTIEKKY